MSIPGVDLENSDPVQPESVEDPNLTPPADDAADDDEGLVETVNVGDRKMAPVAELIKYRKQARAAEKKLTEQQAQIEAVQQQLDTVRPYVERMRDPAVMAKLTEQTAPSRGTEQPVDDVEARELAEDFGLITASNELDIARARRALDIFKANARREAETAMAPMRQNAVDERAGHLREQAKRAMTKDGSAPLASEESIDMAYRLLPPALIASDGVAPIANLIAAGIDHYLGRRTKRGTEYAEPEFVESGRSRGPAPLASEEAKLLEKVGLDQKTYRDIGTQMERSAGSRRGVALE